MHSVAAPVYGGYGGYGAGYGVSKVVSPISTVVNHGYGSYKFDNN